MFNAGLLLAMCGLTISIGVAVYVMLKRSSTIPDRILLMDTITYMIIGIIAILSVMMDTESYLVSILLLGILAFLSTISLCRFVERGAVIERERVD